MPTRRNTTLALTSFLAAPATFAQASGRTPVVGALQFVGTVQSFQALLLDPLKEALHQKGWSEGQQVTFLARAAGSDLEVAKKAAEEFVGRKVDVIVAAQTPAALAAVRATAQAPIPIVLFGVADPVGSGLVKSLSRPGGSITGTSSTVSSMGVKTLQILGQIVPGLRRAGVFVNPDDPFSSTLRGYVEDAGRTLGIQVHAVPVRSGDKLDAAVAEMVRHRVQALVVQPTVPRSIIPLALAQKIPTAGPTTGMIADGCLMAYGPDLRELARQTAEYVDRILKGARPADLPVAEPTHFELALNLATARLLGMTIPQSVLLQASRVVE